MTREVGFSKDNPPRDGYTPAAPRRRVLITSAVLCVMGGVGGAMALDALGDGNALGFAVGAIWCVALVSWGASKLIKNLLGIDTRRPDRTRHDWTLGEDDT